MSLVAIYLSAAFDTVDHTILLDILNNKFGITDKALKWFDSYLRPRAFKVAIENDYHSKKTQLRSMCATGFVCWSWTIQSLLRTIG